MGSRILTGLKPTGTGDLHLGNYVGALRPIVNFANQSDNEIYLFIADYHSLINIHDPKQLASNTLKVAAALFALCSEHPNVHIYRQSDIPEILELNFILSCFTSKGLMNRAHAYKAAIDKNKELGRADLDDGVNMGLYTYPILMAADIIIFQPDFVPVGQDQQQHLEITRDILDRLNHIYGAELKSPSAVTSGSNSTILGLDGQKMSKSYHNTIPLFGTEKELKKLINKIKTDSRDVNEPKDHETSILYKIYSHFGDKADLEKMQTTFASGAGYGEIKSIIFDAINSELQPIRSCYEKLLTEPDKINQQLQQTANKIRPQAQELIKKLRQRCGLSI